MSSKFVRDSLTNFLENTQISFPAFASLEPSACFSHTYMGEERPELKSLAQLLSYVPTTVVEYYIEHIHADTSKELEEQFDAVLMFADMSGFLPCPVT